MKSSTSGLLLSVNVGLPKDVAWQGRTVHTGIWKWPVEGPQMVRRLNIDGDGQGDLAGHGGEQRAVLVYQAESYAHWRQELGRDDLEFGQFGENLTVDGLPDDEVHIGDRYRIGEAEFEVTQPRVTCFRVGLRLGEPELPALLVSHHRPGFYLRVIREGHVQVGDPIVQTRIGRHRLSVADIDALLYLPGRETRRLRAAVDIPALSPGWQQSFHELLDDAEQAEKASNAADPVAGGEPAWPGFRALRVVDVVPETSTVTSIYLTSVDGTPLPAAQAGQFLTLRVTGAAEPPPVRSYSLSSRPGSDAYRISVKAEALGVVSRWLQTHLQPGDVIETAAPRGEFVLSDGTGPVVLISAGVGVTPVLAMLQQLAATASERRVCWVHTARDPSQHPFAQEAHRLLQLLPHGEEHVFYTSPDAPPSDDPVVVRGRPTLAALRTLGLPADGAAYICGPASFMQQMQDDLQRLGLAADQVHTEVFGSLSAINPGIVGARSVRPHPPAGDAGSGPGITFVRSDLTVPWSDRYRSILELAEACDVATRWSCRTGVCHTCVTPLLSGDIDYAVQPLEMPAPGSTLICCSRPDSDVVLDL